MTDLSVLRGAKQALDEGLITQQDYECVKVAFLKAQQIKAGLDAGFIRKEDYDKAVDSYMHALDFQLMTAVPSLSAPQARTAAPSVAAPASQAAYPTSYQQQSQPAPAPAAPPRPSPMMGAAAGMRFGRNSSSGGGNSGGGNADWGPGSGSLSAQTSDQSQDFGPSINVDIPTDLPDYCKGATAGKKSMSGIAIDESCVNLFMHMKTRKAYKWLVFKVDDSGRTVVPDMIGGPASSYNEFITALPETQPRYAVYDYEYRSPERGAFKKLVFLLW
eukprot:GHUV01020464.1.p1 GENE.GHUV01020464.1~~GHUV01020464.1.p1  ORF type:complete len:274 (+),score=72.67 GHUV01020464.1:245-1066(+)